MSIGIAVVGAGLIGKKHLALVRANPDTHLIAVVAPDHAENHAIAAAEGVPLYFSLEACGQAQMPDAVIVSSPNAFHFEQSLWCMERRIPVLIEKPVTVSVKEARRLMECADRLHAKAMVGHHRAYSPLLAKAQEVIASGRLGRLVSFMGSAQFYKPAQYFLEGVWRTQPGGGPILINLIHEIGNMRALMGEIVEVQALASSAMRKFVVEDSVVMNFRFASGALGTFVLSDTAASAMSWEQTSEENPAYASYKDVDCYTLCGTQGSLSFPTMRLRYASKGDEASWWQPMVEERLGVQRDDPLRCQLAHFVALIKDQAEAKVSVIDGYRNLLVIEAIQQAIENGRTIRVGA